MAYRRYAAERGLCTLVGNNLYRSGAPDAPNDDDPGGRARPGDNVLG